MVREFINNERFVHDSVAYYGRIPFATFGLKSELSLLQGAVSITDVFDLKHNRSNLVSKACTVQASRFRMKTVNKTQSIEKTKKPKRTISFVYLAFTR